MTIIESVERNEELRLPAVTVCAFPGWTNYNSRQYVGAYVKMCQNESTAEGFSSCIKNKTFSFKELVLDATHGTNTDNHKNLSDFNVWTWDMTLPVLGRCYTLDYDVPVGIDLEDDIMMIRLNESLAYIVVLHETSLFAVTTNRLAATTYRLLSPKTDNRTTQLTLEAAKWERRNRPELPCNPSPDYNFTECVIEGKAKMVGCTLPWNKKIQGIHSIIQN